MKLQTMTLRYFSDFVSVLKHFPLQLQKPCMKRVSASIRQKKSLYKRSVMNIHVTNDLLCLCVLQADEPGRRVIQRPILMPDGSDDAVNVLGAVRVVPDGPGVHASDGGDAAVLVDVDVGVVPEDDLAAPDVAVHEDGDEVGHGARRHEQRGLLARERGHLRLEALRGGVRARPGRRRRPWRPAWRRRAW
jgi:hypothetical protein